MFVWTQNRGQRWVYKTKDFDGLLNTHVMKEMDKSRAYWQSRKFSGEPCFKNGMCLANDLAVFGTHGLDLDRFVHLEGYEWTSGGVVCGQLSQGSDVAKSQLANRTRGSARNGF